MTAPHDVTVAHAFDRQAAAFEQAPIQTDPRLLAGLVDFADIPPGSHVLDAGCGPGLVAEALLSSSRGYRVLGCDLSVEMIRRARMRCARFGDRAEFVQGEVTATLVAGRRLSDSAVTRLVLHHVARPLDFVRSMAAAVRPGGVVVLADHVADADPSLAEWHRRVETLRDRSHVANLSRGALLDLAARTGLTDLRYEEHVIATDFDEWFARGTPSASRDDCLALLLSPDGDGSRAWNATPMANGNAWITGVVAFVRGRVPE